MEDQKGDSARAPMPSGSSTGKAKRAKKSRVKSNHPKYSDMVMSALKDMKKPRGASRQAIGSYITSNYSVGAGSSRHINMALKSMVNNSSLIRTKGTGASGCFKINKEKAVQKKAAAKTQKPKVRESKKTSKRSKPLKAKKVTKKKVLTKKRSSKKSVGKRAIKKTSKGKTTKSKQGKRHVKKK